MRKIPGLPASAPSHKGHVPVVLDMDPRGSNDEPCSGFYDPTKRVISVQADLALVDQWCVLLHETLHMAITDADLPLDDEQEERVCVAVANWLVSQMLDPKAVLVPRRNGRR